jgi:hypothetical protein
VSAILGFDPNMDFNSLVEHSEDLLTLNSVVAVLKAVAVGLFSGYVMIMSMVEKRNTLGTEDDALQEKASGLEWVQVKEKPQGGEELVHLRRSKLAHELHRRAEVLEDLVFTEAQYTALGMQQDFTGRPDAKPEELRIRHYIRCGLSGNESYFRPPVPPLLSKSPIVGFKDCVPSTRDIEKLEHEAKERHQLESGRDLEHAMEDVENADRTVREKARVRLATYALKFHASDQKSSNQRFFQEMRTNARNKLVESIVGELERTFEPATVACTFAKLVNPSGTAHVPKPDSPPFQPVGFDAELDEADQKVLQREMTQQGFELNPAVHMALRKSLGMQMREWLSEELIKRVAGLLRKAITELTDHFDQSVAVISDDDKSFEEVSSRANELGSLLLSIEYSPLFYEQRLGELVRMTQQVFQTEVVKAKRFHEEEKARVALLAAQAKARKVFNAAAQLADEFDKSEVPARNAELRQELTELLAVIDSDPSLLVHEPALNDAVVVAEEKAAKAEARAFEAEARAKRKEVVALTAQLEKPGPSTFMQLDDLITRIEASPHIREPTLQNAVERAKEKAATLKMKAAAQIQAAARGRAFRAFIYAGLKMQRGVIGKRMARLQGHVRDLEEEATAQHPADRRPSFVHISDAELRRREHHYGLDVHEVGDGAAEWQAAHKPAASPRAELQMPAHKRWASHNFCQNRAPVAAPSYSGESKAPVPVPVATLAAATATVAELVKAQKLNEKLVSLGNEFDKTETPEDTTQAVYQEMRYDQLYQELFAVLELIDMDRSILSHDAQLNDVIRVTEQKAVAAETRLRASTPAAPSAMVAEQVKARQLNDKLAQLGNEFDQTQTPERNASQELYQEMRYEELYQELIAVLDLIDADRALLTNDPQLVEAIMVAEEKAMAAEARLRANAPPSFRAAPVAAPSYRGESKAPVPVPVATLAAATATAAEQAKARRVRDKLVQLGHEFDKLEATERTASEERYDQLYQELTAVLELIDMDQSLLLHEPQLSDTIMVAEEKAVAAETRLRANAVPTLPSAPVAAAPSPAPGSSRTSLLTAALQGLASAPSTSRALSWRSSSSKKGMVSPKQV